MPVHHVGYVQSPSTSPLQLEDVLYVPYLKYNLILVQKLCHDNNCEVGFDASSVLIKDMGTILSKSSSDGMSAPYLL